ncbi:hypothetical protein IWW57_006526, partial [Coemansia sp. S610]
MNNHFHPNAVVAGQSGPGNQGFGVLGFSHLGHGMVETSLANPGSVLTVGSSNSMALGTGALTTGNITAMHPPGQVTAMPPPTSGNSQHLAQQMHAQASHPQYLYQRQQLLMNAANGGWFMPGNNGVPQGMIGSMAGQIGAGAFAQDRSMAAVSTQQQQQQQQGTQALLSHLVSLAPPQSSFSAANMTGAVHSQQQQQRQYPGSLFVEQQMNQILQRQHQLLASQQSAPHGNQHESENASFAAALSLEHSQAMPPPPPPPKSAPMQLGQPSTSSPSVPPGPQRQPFMVQAGLKAGQQPLLTPQLTSKE